MDLLKKLTDLDLWNFVEEKNKVKLYDNTTDSILFVRGDAKLEGHEFTPEQMATILTFAGSRAHCKSIISILILLFSYFILFF